VGGFGEVGGGDHGDAAVNYHTLGVQAGPLLARICEGAGVVVEVREPFAGPVFGCEVVAKSADDLAGE